MTPIAFPRPRTALAVLSPLALGACAAFEGLVPAYDESGAGADNVDIASLPAEDPIDPHRFLIESPRQSVVGTPQVVFATDEDTLADFAVEYGVGYDELVAANPGVDPWLPGEGTAVLLPTQHVLPDTPREGIVLNIASKRLYYYPADDVQRDPETGEVTGRTVLTFPVGIGRVGWETPLGETTVIAKAKDPTWWVPASVRKEHAELGDPLPAVVPPGPENPLGTRVLKLDMPGYLIHGTNQPYGVGMRVSHGCVRLYPDNIEFLYELVGVGEPVRIINEPYLIGEHDGERYLESHAPLEDDDVAPADRLDAVLAALQDDGDADLEGHVRAIVASASGVPLRLQERDQGEIYTRVRHVHNTVELGPDAPSLDEVRSMIHEAVADAEAEAGGE
jgi:L,D-transpeptidase ErfK/SrfK